MNLRFEKRALWAAWGSATFFGDQKSLELCLNAKIPVKAQSENVNSAGGFLVPDELSQDVLDLLPKFGLFRREAALRPMATDHQSVPLRIAGGPATFIAENAAAAASDTMFGSLGLTAKKPIALSILSADALEDSQSLGEAVTEDQARKLAEIEDDCGTNGDGSATYGNMTGFAVALADGSHAGGVRAASGHNTYQELDSADLGSLVGALPEQFLPNAKFYCSSYGLGNTFVRLGATAYAWEDTPNGKRPLLQYGGYPIVVTSKLPGAGDQSNRMMIGFGDMRSSTILGSRRQVTIRASLSRFMEKDQIAFRGTSRFEIVNHNLGDAAKPGALVGILGN
jgi:HK97 family phage major capsid protein